MSQISSVENLTLDFEEYFSPSFLYQIGRTTTEESHFSFNQSISSYFS
jgi:hypothetical protein